MCGNQAFEERLNRIEQEVGDILKQALNNFVTEDRLATLEWKMQERYSAWEKQVDRLDLFLRALGQELWDVRIGMELLVS
ncbi:hypothetical protein ACLOJK_009608 [Asimina triloba]